MLPNRFVHASFQYAVYLKKHRSRDGGGGVVHNIQNEKEKGDGNNNTTAKS